MNTAVAPDPSPLLGAFAGVSTSILWTFTALFFAAAAKRISPARVNASRLLVAVVLHLITFRLMTGAWWPTMPTSQLLALAASGVVGLAICDQALLQSFADIGPRRAILVMTTSPLFALAFGIAFLGERPTLIALVGIALTLGGVAWVVLERPTAEKLASAAPETGAESPANTPLLPPPTAVNPYFRRGLILALIGAATQAAGFLLSKMGMGHGVEGATELDPQAATLVRMVFGTLGVMPILAIDEWRRRRIASAAPSPPGRTALAYLLSACGAVTGPYFGVWLSLVAINSVPLGVAQTLCSLQPVLILPFAAWLLKESIGWRAVLGAAIAVGGSAILFLGG